MARTRGAAAPERLIIDSGPIINWSRGDARTRAVMRRAVELGCDMTVPVIVLAEVLRGGARDAPVHRVLKSVDVPSTPSMAGRVAGGLLGTTGGVNTADALVAAEAVLRPGCTLLTADPGDLAPLLVDHPEVHLQVI